MRATAYPTSCLSLDGAVHSLVLTHIDTLRRRLRLRRRRNRTNENDDDDGSLSYQEFNEALTEVFAELFGDAEGRAAALAQVDRHFDPDQSGSIHSRDFADALKRAVSASGGLDLSTGVAAAAGAAGSSSSP